MLLSTENNKKVSAGEVTAIFQSGIQQSGNIELREFCGECIGEFFKWSIKHSSDVMSPAVRYHLKLKLMYMLVGVDLENEKYKNMK